ncbi:MAG TPA: cupin-like domain-containing protein [Rudaea sp.]|jgi:hypothetical protein
MLLNSANPSGRSNGAVWHCPRNAGPAKAADHESVVVERRSGLSAAEFRERYLLPRVPVVLNDASAAWPIHGHGTPDYFRNRHGTQRLQFLGGEILLAALLDRLEASTPSQPAPYPCKFGIAREFSRLLDQVSPRIAFSVPDRQNSRLLPQRLFSGVNNLEIFFGGPGGRFPYLHYDVLHLHAWITQLHGEKEFVLYAPSQQPFLYAKPAVPWQSDIRNHHEPDLERYPLFRHARAHNITIRAGETLFLPCGWWHTARSVSMTISIAHDQLGSDNWPDFVRDVVSERRRNGKAVAAHLLDAYLRLASPPMVLAEALGHRDTGWGSR